MNVAVFGAGMVGGTLGRRFAEVGHRIFFGVPDPQEEKYQKLIQEIGANAQVGTVAQAAQSAEVVILATPWNATQAAIDEAGDLSGKTIIDCTNPLKEDFSGLAVGQTTSGAEQVAEWARGAHVCKAFNQTGFNNMAHPEYPTGRAVMFICGDEDESRKITLGLAEQIGFEAIDAGALRMARVLEPLAMLWIHLAFTTELKRDFAFGILRR